MNKWYRSLGTSKQEQGIITPKAPQNDKQWRQRRIPAKLVNPFAEIYNYIVGWFTPKKKEYQKTNKPIKDKIQPKHTKQFKPLLYRRRTM